MTATSGNRSSWIVLPCLGTLLGFALSRIGFSSYSELHKMLTFTDLRMFYCFLGGLGLCAAGFVTLCARKSVSKRRIHPGTIPGGILFGVGWALCGACPTIPLVQLGEGRPLAAITLVGVILGTVLYRWIHGRFFRWDRGSCSVS